MHTVYVHQLHEATAKPLTTTAPLEIPADSLCNAGKLCLTVCERTANGTEVGESNVALYSVRACLC